VSAWDNIVADCPATREAVAEYMEEHGDDGCPICGLGPERHPAETPTPDRRRKRT
jgi:hypothetical protein